ncbi:MAG: hypothetical protein AAF790_10745, partial [Planctomycetota bacterium]
GVMGVVLPPPRGGGARPLSPPPPGPRGGRPPAAAAVALGLTGAVLASVIASTLQLDHPTGDALRFSLSMKHTGLAFALATTAGLAQQPEAMLLIVVTTPTQHLIAALLDRLASTRVERG